MYERADRIGGLLMYGIPNMKLDKAVVTRRLQLMEAEGVEFVTNTEIGRDIPAPQLVEEFDAVVLCGGGDQGARHAGRRGASSTVSTSPWSS